MARTPLPDWRWLRQLAQEAIADQSPQPPACAPVLRHTWRQMVLWYGLAGLAGRAQMRASTVDRDRAVEVITTAYTEGRLTKDEHDARVEQAMTASTYAQLDSVVADLPGARPPTPAAPPAPPKNNALAIASLVCGVAQLMLWPLAAIPAVVLGHLARRQIRRTGEQGAGLALAGLILGWIGVGFAVLAVTGIVLAAVAFTRSSGGSTHVTPR